MENSFNNKIPLVSVLIPVHNGGVHLQAALESVVSQDFDDMEIVVINDASTDETAQVLAEFEARDSRFRVFHTEKHAGLGAVLNTGIPHCRGKYIARMDADDQMMPGRIRSQVEFMESHDDVVVVGGTIEVVNEKGEHVSTRKYALDDTSIRKNLFLFSPFAHPATVIRKSALEEVGGYPSGFRAEDIALWFMLAEKGKFANLDQVLLKYRVGDSVTLSNQLKFFWEIDKARVFAIEKLGWKVDLRQKLIWNVQRFGIRFLEFLPMVVVMRLFEVFRWVMRKV